MSEYFYDAFISYRHLEHDMAVAKRLHTLLETYHIPGSVAKQCGKKKMGKIFRDEEELPLAVNLSDNIEAALDASEWLIAICTPDYLQSRWCMKEIDHFISKGRRDHILLVLASGTPETSFPSQLTCIKSEEGIKYIEPLAANIVAENTSEAVKKLGTEKLRILAPMLGVGYDDLKRRARQRRIRLTAAITAAVVIVGAALGIYINAQNHKKAELLRQTQNNRIGELLEKAEASFAGGERISAASDLLEAFDISSSAENMRRDEITGSLRRAVYIEPFSAISEFGGQNLRIQEAVAVPDGSCIIGIVNNNSVAKIDCRSGEISYQVSVSFSQITDLKISPDGSRFLANCGMGECVCVWNVSDGSQAFLYESKAGEKYQIANAFFFGDSDTLLIQDMDKFYRVRIDGSEEHIYTMGQYKGTYDKYDNLLTDLTGNSIDTLVTAENSDYTGMCAAVSRDGSKLLVSGKDGSTGVVIVDSKGTFLYELDDMPGAFTEVYSFSPDGKYIFGTSIFGYFGAWDAETGENIYIYLVYDRPQLTSFSKVAFYEDPAYAAFTADDFLYVLSIEDASMVLGGQIDNNNVTPSLDFSRDGEYVFLKNMDLMIIGVRNGSIEKHLEADLSSSFNNVVPVLSGDALFVTKNDGNAWIYSMEGLSCVMRGQDVVQEIMHDKTDDGKAFAGIMLQGENRITDAFKVSNPNADLNSKVYFSSDGKYAVLAYADGVIEIFDIKDGGKVSSMISEYQTRISAVSFSGTMIVTAHESGKILLCNLQDGSVIKAWNTSKACSDVVFSPSGEYFLVLSGDKSVIYVYSCRYGLLYSMEDQDGFTEYGFTVDGKYAAGYSENGYTLGNMFTDETELIERAKRLAGK